MFRNLRLIFFLSSNEDSCQFLMVAVMAQQDFQMGDSPRSPTKSTTNVADEMH